MPDRFDTRALHAGEIRIAGSATLPIFQSTVFELAEGTPYDDIRYPRLNTLPNQTVVAEKVANLEGYEAGLVLGSGMAAITSTLAALFRPGDHLLIGHNLYGGTHSLAHIELADRGIAVTEVDTTDSASWEAALRPETRGLFLEPLSNPLLHVADVEAIAPFCEAHRLLSIVDNTFASPVFFRPSEWGIDLSIHSATKYLNGHSDLVAGTVAGSPELIRTIRKRANLLGGSLDPHAAWLLHRGLKTLGLRVRHQTATATQLAVFLDEHPQVRHVNHPALASHAQHDRAARVLGGFGACFSFELHDPELAASLVRSLRLFTCAPSLGGVESLVTRPSQSSHAGMSPEARAAAGVSDGLVRIAIGLEHVEDLKEDLAAALGG